MLLPFLFALAEAAVPVAWKWPAGEAQRFHIETELGTPRGMRYYAANNIDARAGAVKIKADTSCTAQPVGKSQVVRCSFAYVSLLGMPGSLEYALGNYSVPRRSRGLFQDTRDIVAAMLSGDAFAQWLWLDMVRKLAVFIGSAANGLSPEVVCLAGGVTQAGDSLMEPLERFLEVYEFRPDGVRTQLRIARFGDMAGAIGAAVMAFRTAMPDEA
ncbi:MAG: ROK family protein [Chitinophagia bacterium]|nr:ROK family protein [Chitinophagia bacterium]